MNVCVHLSVCEGVVGGGGGGYWMCVFICPCVRALSTWWGAGGTGCVCSSVHV